MNRVDDLDDGMDVDFTALSQDTRRRTLRLSVVAMLLCARGNGATNATLKGLVLHLRSADVAVLTDADAFEILNHLGLRSA